MKRLILLTVASLLLASSNTSAQSILDKAKNKLEKTSDSPGEFKSLSDIAAQWSDGKYGSRRRSSGMYEPGGKIEVLFIKGDDGVVNEIKLDGKEYSVGSSKSKPFAISYSYRNYSLYITESSIVKYRYASGNKIWVEACYGKKMGIKAAEKEITAFREFAEGVRSKQEAEYFANAQKEAAKAAEERKAKYGLEGKDVASIEFVNFVIPDKFGHFTGFTFDMKATLKDGSSISTENPGEGFMGDYIITYDAENYKSRGLDGTILQSGFLDDDEITVTVTCASNPSVSVSKNVTLKYNGDISFNYRNGASLSSGSGGNASNYRFEVKQVKHVKTGEKLLKVRIINVSDGGSIVSEFKINADQTLHFSCNGGNGGDTWQSDLGNGGNGGNITVIKDPSVEYFNFNYSNQGGNPGNNYAARRGRDGSFKEEVRAVKL